MLENNRFYNACNLTVFNIWPVNGKSPWNRQLNAAKSGGSGREDAIAISLGFVSI